MKKCLKKFIDLVCNLEIYDMTIHKLLFHRQQTPFFTVKCGAHIFFENVYEYKS